MELEFEWDEKKAQANLAKHRVSFLTAAEVFTNEMLERIDDRKITERYAALRLAGLARMSIGSSSPGEANISFA